MALRTIDFSFFTHGNSLERYKVAGQLRNALASHGYVKLVGHGVPEGAVVKMFEWVRDLKSSREIFGLMTTWLKSRASFSSGWP